MKFITFMNDRVKRLTIFDVKLVQGAAMCVALIVVKLVPTILTISIWWFVTAMVLCAIRPMYLFFLKS